MLRIWLFKILILYLTISSISTKIGISDSFTLLNTTQYITPLFSPLEGVFRRACFKINLCIILHENRYCGFLYEFK
uniref:Secreted protein n=1 Tax=Pristhesancus plagipennis TaxID=1955184 RepID=A0A2K8JMD2_PRIPG|nr:secreted hypothetical protein [Pristhesancus plagipennis]